MKKTFIVIICFFVVLVVGYFVAQEITINKIENILASEIKFEEVELSLISCSASIIEPIFDKRGKFFSAKKVQISGINYWKLLWNGKVEINKAVVKNANARLEKLSNGQNKSNPQSPKKKFDKDILVNKVELDGSFVFEQDSLRILKLEKFNIEIDSVGVTSKTLTNKIPFEYKKFNIQLSGISYRVSKLQELQVEKMLLQPNLIELNNLVYLPKFSRKDYVNVIPYEKDLMDLKLKNLKINNYSFDLNKSQNSFSSNFVELNDMNFSIYRDKSVKDDTRKKHLYSKMLRDMNLKLDIDSLAIKNMHLEYEELINKDREPGRIAFENLSMKAYNITNVDLDKANFPETKVNIETQFMGKSKLSVDWRFKVNNKRDLFTIKGSVFKIPESSINSFFVPAFGMRTLGEVEELYFNFKGDKDQARGELKIAYNDFKVEVLKKDSAQKNNFLSALVNVVVKKNSRKNGETITNPKNIERNKTKSFWNYFWTCLQAGLREAITVF
ncbi:hypothetical protein [Mesonia aestuariivivens]|uniref:DUF748 domain-containing protein n=1 Tax=Mesonia aestuariivivens TaxID=2796128 RepID=A0ABS6W414_9FLAO|nr:hypothetical protein [Mesonia aestuariivivens]MBW2962464.1 hypothetical protein [Mesonia aestuariivivens]